jgi:hypothetical protein
MRFHDDGVRNEFSADSGLLPCVLSDLLSTRPLRGAVVHEWGSGSLWIGLFVMPGGSVVPGKPCAIPSSASGMGCVGGCVTCGLHLPDLPDFFISRVVVICAVVYSVGLTSLLECLNLSVLPTHFSTSSIPFSLLRIYSIDFAFLPSFLPMLHLSCLQVGQLNR